MNVFNPCIIVCLCWIVERFPNQMIEHTAYLAYSPQFELMPTLKDNFLQSFFMYQSKMDLSVPFCFENFAAMMA